MINYSLTPFEKAITFQITKQDPKVGDYIKNIGGTFYASNGWKIQVSAEPEVNVFSKTIFLRGSKSGSDLRVDRTWNMPSNAYRDTVIAEVRKALSEIISSVERMHSYGLSLREFVLPVHIAAQLYDMAEVLINVASEVTPTEKKPFRIDSEGWGNNKVNPSRKLVTLV